MKLMICIPQLIRGGAERVVSNLANYFVKNNDVSIVSLRNYAPEYELNTNINLYFLDENNEKNKVSKFLERKKKMGKLLKREKPDLVICFLPEASYLVLMLKKIYKGKIIISVRNDPKKEYNKLYKKILMKILYPKSDGVVFQTNDAKKYFSNKIQKNSKIIPNSISPAFLVPRFEGKRDKKIVAVGRLSNQKNHKLLIKAFSVFCKENKDYKLYIYGDGFLKNELLNYARLLDISDKVFLPGVVNNVKEEIYKAELYVLTSNYEGMPNSLMEALALGIPCISTDCPCGGPKMLIKNRRNGILIKVGNEKELVQEMKNLINNPSETEIMARNANNDMKQFDPSIINNEWDKYLREILKK